MQKDHTDEILGRCILGPNKQPGQLESAFGRFREQFGPDALSRALNQLDEKGNTYLTQLVVEGDSDSVGALIDCGADVNMRDRQGQTPLELAALNNQKACVERLLKAGANPLMGKKSLWDRLLESATVDEATVLPIVNVFHHQLKSNQNLYRMLLRKNGIWF